MNITSQKAQKYDLQVGKYRKIHTSCKKGIPRADQEREGS